MADGNGTADARAAGSGTSLMRAGAAVQAIVPHSFEEAWRVAGALAKSGMAPKGIDSQEQVLAVIMAGAEIGMPPFQALQSFAVINGRVSLWGDGMLGVVRKHGVKVEESLEGEGEKATATCTVTRPDTKEVIVRSFSIADAMRAGLWQTQEKVRRKGKDGSYYETTNDSPWYRYPLRMLQMRARSWALRDGCADLLRGLKMAEEVQDYPEEATVIADVPAPKLRGKEKNEARDAILAEYEAAASVEELDEAHARNAETKARMSDNAQYSIDEMYEKHLGRLFKAGFCACADLDALEQFFAVHETRFLAPDLEVYEARKAEIETEEQAAKEHTTRKAKAPSPTRAALLASLASLEEGK